MKKPTFVIPFPVLYRGFSILAEGPKVELIVKHKRCQGRWVTGYYAYTESDNKHWIFSLDDHMQVEVLPQTVGLLEPFSGHFSGDVCYYQNEIQGILCFGKHEDSYNLGRHEVCFYIDWQGTSITASLLRQDLLYWSKSKDVEWSGTMWDPKSKRK